MGYLLELMNILACIYAILAIILALLNKTTLSLVSSGVCFVLLGSVYFCKEAIL